ncbi:MAG: 6-carboxytetrahydropterin synthase [Rickettsiales bacterium]|nr:6-carboxytetrahydropterin synthase [Rickettsiales bacterium]
MTKPIRCTRRLEFDAAHRVMEHESKCKFLHGHRYVVEATFEATHLDALDRVIDFGVIKEVLGAWIDENWDHATILNEKDRLLGQAIENHTKQTIYWLNGNPTAEKMAAYLLEVICPKLFVGTQVRCVVLRLHETPNCYAEVSA